MEEERIAVLIAGRRQREAKLVADFTSDEIYDLEDESGLAMQQALKESRRRVEWLCEGRKVAGCTELVTDDILAELQSFLTRYDGKIDKYVSEATGMWHERDLTQDE